MLYIDENGEGEIQSIIDTPANPSHNFVNGQCSNCGEMNRKGGEIPPCTQRYKPHEFEGILEGIPDRDCTLCGLPDRDPIHKYQSRFEDHEYTQPRQKGEPYYHDKEGHKLYYVNGLGWVSKKWTELFLENWNETVKLWDKGQLFTDVWYTQEYKERQIKEQQEYARLCCAWIIPNGMVEPHCVAFDLCTCPSRDRFMSRDDGTCPNCFKSSVAEVKEITAKSEPISQHVNSQDEWNVS
jgi:hypothetical protein